MDITKSYHDDEIIGLVSDEVTSSFGYDYEIAKRRLRSFSLSRAVKILLVLIVGVIVTTGTGPQFFRKHRLRQGSKCRFCDQSPPKLREDQSYTIKVPNHHTGEDIAVTPMTVSYEYELRDGENLYTIPQRELVPNLDFDYALLGVTGFRNLHRDDGSPVSLDEVYVHHFSLLPLNMLGAEVLALSGEKKTDPYLQFPPGYALHVVAEETPYLETNAHLLSNKNLAPIDGSLARAHKECNECYYSPTKGPDCTPDKSGTFRCCGDSRSCTRGGAFCACATTTDPFTSTVTKYRIELDLLIARDLDKFKRVDQWNIAAPSCSVLHRNYPIDSYCYHETESSLDGTGHGALFHQIPERPSEDPFVRTATTLVAPADGTLVWAQSHLHTGGVNATLSQNGKILCATDAQYGTDSNSSTNSRNEKGHLVAIGSCYEALGPDGIRFEEGDVFTTESYYYGAKDDPNLGSVSGGEHKNVMSMFFLGVVMDGTDVFHHTPYKSSFNLWNNFVTQLPPMPKFIKSAQKLR